VVSVPDIDVSTPPGCEFVVDVVDVDLEFVGVLASSLLPQPAVRRAIAARIEISRFIRRQATKSGPAFLSLS
jgi:hypothetical protein